MSSRREDNDYVPPKVIEETNDYQLLDWGAKGQGIYCMHCAWISYDEEFIARRYCPVCKICHADRRH